MTDQNNQEPTMEDILASIRRIISEDDPPPSATDETAPHGDPIAVPAQPTAVAAVPDPSPAPPVAAAPEPEPEPEEEVLELTNPIEAKPAGAPLESVGDLDVFEAPPAAVAPRPTPVAPAVSRDDGGLVSSPAADSAGAAFAALSRSIAVPRDGHTLEDVVRDLLRPLLKQWLDENLPRIVESAVQSEVERIARSRG